MNRIVTFALLMSFACSIINAASGPVTYHLAFDNLGMIQDLLKDDWVNQTGFKTVDDRKWDLVEGRFGRALYIGGFPLQYDADNMSGLDLDMVTALIFNLSGSRNKERGYDEPFIWGAGKLHPAFGSVAFWVKGSSKANDEDTRTILFEQTTTTWGRKERQLIEIELYRDRTISAYVEDARYFQHTVKSGPVWDDNGWNHVVFMWDRASGISLWVNGREAASTMGTDAWWENQRPGLFHLPMSLAAYDEFYMFNRTLTPDEIRNLYTSNTPPSSESIRASHDGAKRLKKAFIDEKSRLPVATPFNGKTLVFTEITPDRIWDEGISGWWICDGRYELAWPHEYSVFTIIPGDVDFHAEKADILPPPGSNVNYITLEGNLDDVSVLRGDRSGNFQPKPLFRTGKTTSFFYGAMTTDLGDGELRIPFTKFYGVPPGFQSDGDVLHLPQSGDLRIHEVGLFNVAEKSFESRPGDRTFYLNAQPVPLHDKRYPSALNALFSLLNGRVLGLTSVSPRLSDTITLEPMNAVNLISEPAVGKGMYNTIILDLNVTSPTSVNIIALRVLDPAIPSHTWSHAEAKLKGFTESKPQRLRLALAFTPMCLVEGDRLWIELLATDGLSINLDHATVTLRPVIEWNSAMPAYAMKTLMPCIMGYSRSFEYIPWVWDKHMPSVDAPENFGGQYDMAYPWQAVLKVDPGNKIANIYKAYTDLVDLSLPPPRNVAYPYGRYPRDMNNVPDRYFDAPSNAPDWAIYFREFQTYRNRIITWWRAHQRSDGQVGGGWNDDTLIFSRSFGDMILDSNPDALALYNRVFDGFDKTNYFKDGYCRISPIDRLHNADFVRERYKSLIYNLGDPRSAVWAMEEAWHWDKPDKTPMNYGNGGGFLFGKDVLEWYWGKRKIDAPYRLTNRPAVVEELRKAAIVNNDTTLWRFTEAWVHTDDQSQYGSGQMENVLLGGWGINSRSNDSNITITLGVGWLEGGGPETGRLVEYSGNDGFQTAMYSFSTHEKPVTVCFYRLEPGTYVVSLKADEDNNGSYETVLVNEEQDFRRFDTFSFTLPPQVPVFFDVKQIKKAPDPGALPDLAVSSYFVERKGSDVVVTIYNIGNAPSGAFTVSVVDEKSAVISQVRVNSLDGSGDFVPKKATVTFPKVPRKGIYRIAVDPEDIVREIYEGNNSVVF